MSDKRYNINYSWTQNYSLNPDYHKFEFVVNDWVYYNESMMQSIEYKLAEMDRFPDAEKIFNNLKKSK